MKEKTIRTNIILGEGEFVEGGNTKVIEGLATTVTITKAGLPEKNSAEIRITGMKMKDMEQLTFLSFMPGEYRKNHILIEAGTKNERVDIIFKGDITAASADFSGAPDVVFKIQAITAGWRGLVPDVPMSINGEADAARLIERCAFAAGYGFTNEGVSAVVKNCTFNGSAIQKAQQIAEEIGAELLIDDDTMVLMPYGKPRGDAVYLAADSGMIGYPSFTNDGITVESFFNPRLRLGGQVRIVSVVPRASGWWKITKLSHDISAYTQGRWVSKIDGMYLTDDLNKPAVPPPEKEKKKKSGDSSARGHGKGKS